MLRNTDGHKVFAHGVGTQVQIVWTDILTLTHTHTQIIQIYKKRHTLPSAS